MVKTKMKTLTMKWNKEVRSANGREMKRTISQKNLTSQNDDNDVTSPKLKWTGMKRGKAKKTISHKKPAVSDALICCIASKGSAV